MPKEIHNQSRNRKSREWVEPEEEEEKDPQLMPETHEVDLSKLIPFTNSGHQWHQEGAYLICDSCMVRHAAFIGIDKVLKGFDEDGNPLIEKRF
jgi:hypothetical protein